MDATGFERLLAIAGPEPARALLEQLRIDLRDAAGRLGAGLDAGDMGLVRAATHVLVALAGMVGACGLQRDAQALHDDAAAGDADGAARRGPGVAAGIEAMAAALIRRGAEAAGPARAAQSLPAAQEPLARALQWPGGR